MRSQISVDQSGRVATGPQHVSAKPVGRQRVRRRRFGLALLVGVKGWGFSAGVASGHLTTAPIKLAANITSPNQAR